MVLVALSHFPLNWACEWHTDYLVNSRHLSSRKFRNKMGTWSNFLGKFPSKIVQFNLDSKTEFILQLLSNTKYRPCGRIAEILVSYSRCRICLYKDHKSLDSQRQHRLPFWSRLPSSLHYCQRLRNEWTGKRWRLMQGHLQQ